MEEQTQITSTSPTDASETSGHFHLPLPLSPSIVWFELFYDLVFVACVIVFSNAVSHHPTWESAIGVSGVFVVVWFVWLLNVLLVNKFHRDDPAQRGLVLVQMFLVTLVAVGVGDGTPSHFGWVGPLAGALLAVTAAMYARPAGRNDLQSGGVRSVQKGVALSCMSAALMFTATGVLTGGLSYIAWLLGGVLTIAPAIVLVGCFHPSCPRVDAAHLVERLGAFTILVCGESFVKVALTAADGTLDGIDVWVMGFEFVLIFSVWWAYFDDIPRAGMPVRGPRRAAWAVAHLPLHLALVGVAVGASKFIVSAAAQDLTTNKLVLITVPLAGTYVALGLVGWMSPRHRTWSLALTRIGTATLVVLTAAVWWGLEPSGAEGLFGMFALIALANAWTVHLFLDQPSTSPSIVPTTTRDVDISDVTGVTDVDPAAGDETEPVR